MFLPEKMEQVHVLFSEKELDPVVDAVVQQGMLQMVDSASVSYWAHSSNTAKASS